MPGLILRTAARCHIPGRQKLTEIKAKVRVGIRSYISMGPLIFKCPHTGMNVQHWLADEVAADDRRCTYDTVVCQACSRVHFINRSSGKLLGEKAR